MAGMIDVDFEKCKGCGLCVSVCSGDVLEMSSVTNVKGYYYPVAGDGCSGCAMCGEICPDVCIRVYRD